MYQHLVLIIAAFLVGVRAQCSCRSDVASYSYTCDDPALTQMPTCVPDNITQLVLQNTSIPITADSFSRFPNLTTVYISYLPLDTLPADVFRANPQLYLIFIHHTTLSFIPPDFFTYVPKLRDFAIHTNALRALPEDTFTYAQTLAYLYTYSNQLTTLSPTTFANTNLTTITMFDNPWICDCNLVTFQRWLVNSDIYLFDPEEVTCHSPPELNGVPLTEIPSRLPCVLE